jgi:GH24 family phage-related lysozyme (muramidase)
MDNKPKTFKDYLNPLLEESEGFSEVPYQDQRGFTTVGHGFNLDAEDTANLMRLQGIDVDGLKSNQGSLSRTQADTIRDSILEKKQDKLRNRINPDMYDQLPENQKAALMSLMYNSPGLIGPNLMRSIASTDNINAAREIMLNSNKKKDPGILNRRIKEAQMYMGDQFGDVVKTLSSDEKNEILKILNKTENENTRQELLNKYGQELGLTPKPASFNKLK